MEQYMTLISRVRIQSPWQYKCSEFFTFSIVPNIVDLLIHGVHPHLHDSVVLDVVVPGRIFNWSPCSSFGLSFISLNINVVNLSVDATWQYRYLFWVTKSWDKDAEEISAKKLSQTWIPVYGLLLIKQNDTGYFRKEDDNVTLSLFIFKTPLYRNYMYVTVYRKRECWTEHYPKHTDREWVVSGQIRSVDALCT